MISNILQYLELQEKNNANKPAILDKDGRKITFKELAEQSRQVGSFLAEFGFRKQAIPV